MSKRPTFSNLGDYIRSSTRQMDDISHYLSARDYREVKSSFELLAGIMDINEDDLFTCKTSPAILSVH